MQDSKKDRLKIRAFANMLRRTGVAQLVALADKLDPPPSDPSVQTAGYEQTD